MSDVAVNFAADVATMLQELHIQFRAAVIGQLVKGESVRRFSRSTSIADGFFPRLVAELRDHLLSQEYDDSIGFANDVAARVSEVEKFCRISNWSRSVPKMRVVYGKDSFYEKVFVASRVYVKEGRADKVEHPDCSKRVLLCTATDVEDDCLLSVAKENGYEVQTHNGAKGVYRKYAGPHTAFAVRSSMGSGGSGGALATVMDAISDVQPTFVISCGLAFGHSHQEQKLGDVLVSESVRSYEKQRLGADQSLTRGSLMEASPYLLQVARIVRTDLPYAVHSGVILSGEKLVDNPDFKKQLWDIEPEAVGGEMEGAGVVAACHRHGIDWIVVKAICDWGENKGNDKQPEAARHAFEFAFRMIERGDLNRKE